MASADESRPRLPPSHVSISGTLSSQPATETEKAVSRHSTSSTLGIPDLPPRPSSAPPGGHDGSSSAPPSPLLQAPQEAIGNMSLQGVNTASFSSPDHSTDHLTEDEIQSSRSSRFFGNMLISRVGRASWQSLESTARLPFYLSPWGDNHPFTLPNVRKRDIALAGVAHFGLDALGTSAVTVVESAFTHAASATVEQTADESIQKVTGRNKPAHTVERKVGMNSLTLRIKHKLIGEAAELVFQGVRDTDDRTACAKGWFCPYLYASGREPEIARAKDFTMAQLLRPRLAADANIAPTLLTSFVESNTPILSPFGLPWGDASPTSGEMVPRFRRMALILTGISPYRYITSKSGWSHSRIPNEARITFHVFTHVPAIVLPVKDQSPILAWSPWTVAQMLGQKSKYDIRRHVKVLLDFIQTVIDEDAIKNNPQNANLDWRHALEASLLSMLNTVFKAPDAVRETAKECCELERTGLVALRY